MARKMMIVHGYSDDPGSFGDLKRFFVEQAGYRESDICFADYSSMDDDASFRDFADKLDEDYERLSAGWRKKREPTRIDIACHSTGALVVRAWLAMRFVRRTKRKGSMTCPVNHLLMFAPANFGSDLARMGQSLLGKAKATFFDSSQRKGNAMESGRQVLEGLEPASPFQWELSDYDLFCDNEENPADSGFFDPRIKDPRKRCYPFVFAAGESYGGMQARIIKKRQKPGTDGTVRICGTSLNVTKFTIDFRESGSVMVPWARKRYPAIPFAVFAGFNHGSIVHPSKTRTRWHKFVGPDGPGTLALAALEVGADPKTGDRKYAAAVKRFARANEVNYDDLARKYQDRYQQIFFRVYDDVEREVDDFYADFYVQDHDGGEHRKLTKIWDEKFESTFYRHSARASCRAMLLNLSELKPFVKRLEEEKAKLVLELSASSPVREITYQTGTYVVYDGATGPPAPDKTLIHPNTTTLVRAVLNRKESDLLMRVKP